MRSVCLAAGLNEIEMALVERYITDLHHGDSEFVDTTAYEKLFNYFCFETGLMPYSVAKAKTDEPDRLILDRLEEMSKSHG